MLEVWEGWKTPHKSAKDDQFLRILQSLLPGERFALDGLGLYADDLLKPALELIKNPTIWWTNLGKDDNARVKKFDALSEFRIKWWVFARTALGRVLGDILAYEMNPTKAKLLPLKKKRVVVVTASLFVKEVEKTSPDDI